MLKKYITVEFLFFLTGFLVFIYRSLFSHDSFDFVYHDTYLLIDPGSITIILMILLGFLGLPYLILRMNGRPMYRIMGWIHYFFTILPWFLYEIVIPAIIRFQKNENANFNITDSEAYIIIISTGALLFMASQLIFFINIILTLLKRMDI